MYMLKPNGGGDFCRWLGHEVESLMNGISALIKEMLQSSLALFHHVKTQQEVGSLKVRRGPSLELDHADTLILDFQPPEL